MKTKNSLLNRQQVQRKKTSRSTLKRPGRAFRWDRLFFATVLSVGFALSAYLSYAALLGLSRIKIFRLDQVTYCFGTDCQLDRSKVQGYALDGILAPFHDDNLYSIPLDHIVKNLKIYPEIASISYRRIFPNDLVLTIVEENPVAMTRKDGDFFYINRKGKIFHLVTASDNRDFPIIGCDRNFSRIDLCYQQSIRVLELFTRNSLDEALSEINLSERNVGVIFIGTPFKVVFDHNLTDEVIKRWKYLKGYVASLDGRITRLDFTMNGKAVARTEKSYQ